MYLNLINIKSYRHLLEKPGVTNIFLATHFTVLLFFVYKTSYSLPPFRDEIVSLTANVGFFLKGLNFEGPKNTIFEGLYNPYLTSPPLSAVGSSFAWKFSDNLNSIRISNFLWVLLVQLIFSFFISKIYDLNIKKLIIFSSFSLVAYPFWFGSLYSLGETISIIIFFNSLLLYKTYPKTSILLMGSLVFFGKIILGVLFVFFYIFNLLTSKSIKNVPSELIIFTVPSLFWILLILFKSDYPDIFTYINHFLNHWEYMGSQVGNLSLRDTLSLDNIFHNFKNSGVSSWNLSVILRVFVPPVILFILLIIKKGKNMMLEINQYIYFAAALIPIYGWFVLISPEKPIIYAAHFTFPMLMFSFYLLSRKNLSINLVNSGAFFICCLYMTSSLLFIISIFFLFLIVSTKKINYSIIILLIFLSLINSTYEVSKEKTFSVDLSLCKTDITSYECYEYLMNISKN